MSVRKLAQVFGVALAIIIVLGCRSTVPTPVVQAAAEPAPSPTAPGPAEHAYIASGPLVVENQVELAAERDGTLAKILAEPGKHVLKGDLLAQLDDRQISAELEAARAKTRSTVNDLGNWKAEAKVLEADYERARKMWDAQLITKEQLDHARYKAESDQWDVKRVEEMIANSRATERSLEFELDKTRIQAPFSGVVARRYVSLGQTVAKGERLFWVTATSPLLVRFSLPETFVGKVRRGQTVSVISTDVPDEPHPAKIIQLSPVVDPASGTIDVEAEVLGGAGKLYPGMTASIRVEQQP